jgi:hypothetical protein
MQAFQVSHVAHRKAGSNVEPVKAHDFSPNFAVGVGQLSISHASWQQDDEIEQRPGS